MLYCVYCDTFYYTTYVLAHEIVNIISLYRQVLYTVDYSIASITDVNRGIKSFGEMTDRLLHFH